MDTFLQNFYFILFFATAPLKKTTHPKNNHPEESSWLNGKLASTLTGLGFNKSELQAANILDESDMCAMAQVHITLNPELTQKCHKKGWARVFAGFSNGVSNTCDFT